MISRKKLREVCGSTWAVNEQPDGSFDIVADSGFLIATVHGGGEPYRNPRQEAYVLAAAPQLLLLAEAFILVAAPQLSLLAKAHAAGSAHDPSLVTDILDLALDNTKEGVAWRQQGENT